LGSFLSINKGSLKPGQSSHLQVPQDPSFSVASTMSGMNKECSHLLKACY